MAAVETYGKLGPLYNAMVVCSLALEEIEPQEAERQDAELLAAIIRSVRATRAFIKPTTEKDIPKEATKEQILDVASCIRILTAMIQYLSKQTRQILPHISHKYRDAIAAQLDECDEITEQMEDIMEAWVVAGDEEFVSKISESVKEIDRNKKEIPDWRKSLESISD